MQISLEVDSGSETELSVSHHDLIAKAKNIRLEEARDSQESSILTVPFPEEGIKPPQTNNSPSAFDFLMSSQENGPLCNKEQKMRCPCESDEKTSTIFQCLECGYWSHAVSSVKNNFLNSFSKIFHLLF